MMQFYPYDLTVVMTTCDRPELYRQVLNYLSARKSLPIRVEAILVDESDSKIPSSWTEDLEMVIRKKKEGFWGAAAKDVAIKHVSGEYVCFWDDDNVYYDNCLLSLYNAAQGHDIGVVQVTVNNGEESVAKTIIPRVYNGRFVSGRIDTMCFCVRSELAKRHRWIDGCPNRDNDFRYIDRISKETQDINFVPGTVGELIPWKSRAWIDRLRSLR